MGNYTEKDLRYHISRLEDPRIERNKRHKLMDIVMIVLAARKTRQDTAQNVTLKVDLPGDTQIEAMKCKSCGGTLTADNIKLVNGAPMVTCPYCNSVYQLTEEPKW